MDKTSQPIEALADIKKMMERSSRFISLSGWSGVSAGVCALVGAWVASPYILVGQGRGISQNPLETISPENGRYIAQTFGSTWRGIISTPLFWIAFFVLIAAFSSAFFFTWQKSKKQGIPVWGSASKRLMISVALPMAVAGVFVYRLLDLGLFGLVAPACLIFYGLALLNASKYTFPEIKYLGLAQIVLGLINAWYIGFGIYFWAIGFGVLHIVYGIYMWAKYEKV